MNRGIRKILLLLLTITLCFTTFSAIGFVSANTFLPINEDEYDLSTGFYKNPYDPIEIKLSFTDSQKNGIRIGLQGNYGQRATREQWFDLREVKFKLDVNEMFDNTVGSFFFADSPSSFPGDTGIGFNMFVKKINSGNVLVMFNDGRRDRHDKDSWGLFSDDTTATKGFNLTSCEIDFSIKKMNSIYKVVCNNQSKDIPSELIEGQLGYNGEKELKLFLTIGLWGESSAYRYITLKNIWDLSMKEYEPLRDSVYLQVNNFEKELNLIATKNDKIKAVIDVNTLKESINFKLLRKNDYEYNYLPRIGKLNDNFLTALKQLNRLDFTKLIDKYLTDYETLVSSTTISAKEKIDKANIYRSRLAFSNYKFANNMLSSDKTKCSNREQNADVLFNKLIEKKAIDEVLEIETKVKNLAVFEDYLKLQNLINIMDLSYVTASVRETLLARVEIAKTNFLNKQKLNNFNVLGKPLVKQNEDSINFYSDGMIREDSSVIRNFLHYKKMFDVTSKGYNFNITMRVDTYPPISGADGYFQFGLMKNANTQNIEKPFENLGYMIQFKKNGDKLSAEIYLVRSITNGFTMATRGVAVIDYPKDGVIKISIKRIGNNMVTSINNNIPTEWSAVTSGEWNAIFSNEDTLKNNKANLIISSHMVNKLLDVPKFGMPGFVLSLLNVNNNKMNADDLTIMGTDEFILDTEKDDGIDEKEHDKKGCSCGTLSFNSKNGIGLLSLLFIFVPIIILKKRIIKNTTKRI